MEVNELSAKYLVASAYAQTELGYLPSDWRIAEIGDIAETSSGTTPSRGQYDRYFKSGVHAWVKTLDLNNAEIWLTDESVTDAALQETSLRLFPAGSVLVAMYGGLRQIGRTGLLRIPAAVNQAITVIRPDSACLWPDFLLFYLNHRVGYWQSVASSSRKDPNITGADVRAFKLPLPSTEEQQQIASALTDADTLIDSLEQLLTKKRQIKQGAMQELLTGKRRLPGFEQPWISRAFADVASVSRERVNPSGLNSPPLCVELEHLEPGTGRLSGEAFESQQAATKSVFQRGDVLFGKLRAYLRKYWLADFDGVCSTEIWVLRARGELGSNAYLFYTIQRDDFISAASTAYGTHMPRSDWKIVGEFDLALPSDATEQVAIAEVLSNMDSEISALEARLSKARALKQAMAQALLTGRIRLVEPTT